MQSKDKNKLYSRMLSIQLPHRQSAFLWGARKTGKTTYLKQNFKEATFIDLLTYATFDKFNKNPSLLREELALLKENQIVIIDEVQKVPQLLDEVHWLIENKHFRFILCGSSARKLKRGQANLLGGRAWRYNLHPLSVKEVPDFDLMRALNTGLLPDHFLSHDPQRSLQGYVLDYLKEEIQAEALTRNLRAFSSFLDSLGFSTGEITNYSNIARELGIDAKTVKGYYQILEDTLLGFHIFPFRKSRGRKDIVTSPKFYLFDVGVANYLAKRRVSLVAGTEAGKAFEHLVFMELKSFHDYMNINDEIYYWRTRTGLEVDFIINSGNIALEVKINRNVQSKNLSGLKSYLTLNPTARGYVICPESTSRLINLGNVSVTLLDFQTYVNKLWSNSL